VFFGKGRYKMRIYNAMVVGAAVIALCTPSTFAKNSTACPSDGTPAPGSHVNGGLEVNGVCILNGVTVDGGVTVTAKGHLQVQITTINGGIVVEPGGELDVNATTLGSGTPTHTSSTINGTTTVNKPFDTDVWTARLDGGFAIDSQGSQSFLAFCGNEVKGDSSFSNLALTANIGGGMVFSFPCGGNRFDGSVSLTNLTAFMGGTTINGDLLCTNAAVIVTEPNTITGKNTCY
jgi:hypothetical protein